MSDDLTNYYRKHPTPAELNAVLGARWAICKDTPTLRARYGLCISPAIYKAACGAALRRRALMTLVTVSAISRGMRMHLDRHAIAEAAKMLEEEALAMRFTMEMPSGERLLAGWLRRNGLNGNDPLRDRVRQLSHTEEMARRLRRMLEQVEPIKTKGASRRKRRPVKTRTARRSKP